MKLLKTMEEKTRLEVEFPTMNTSSSDRTVTKAFEYHLTCDKVRRTFIPSQRDYYIGLGRYAMNVAKGLQNSKTWTFVEAFEMKDSQRQFKNHAYRLVGVLNQEKVIGSKWMQVARIRFKFDLNIIKVVEQ